MEPIGVGVIGCGFVGMGAHVPALSEMGCARLVAVADASEAARAKAQSKYGAERAYCDYAELVADPDIRAVIVSVPTPLHAAASLAAIEAGKHVLCEMPLATTLEDADHMIDAARDKGVFLMPSLTFRFTPNYVKAKQLIDNGAVGRATSLSYREWIPAADLAKQWPPDTWMWRVEQSGGPLFTLAVWSIDLLRWLSGSEIEEVCASTKYTRLEKTGGTLGYDAVAALRFTNGCVGALQYSGSVNKPASISRLEVVGDATSVLTATDNDLVTLLADEPTRTEWNVKQKGARMWGHYMQDEHFVTCVRDGKAPCIAPEDGPKAMAVALRIAHAAPQATAV